MPYPAKDTLPSADQPLIEISKCDVWVEKVQLLHDINFALRSGEHWGIVGLNGSGKSSFLKFLHGDYRPALGGTICRFGQDEYASVEDIHALFGYVGMELQAHYHYNVTALEAAASGFFSSIGIYREVSEEQLEHARMWLTFFSMGEHAERPIHEMSHGQLRRVLLARAMVHGPRVLLLDEPFNGLDRASHAALTQTLEELAARGVTLFIATHHMEDLVPSINRIAVFHGGRMIRQGPRGEVLHGN